MKEKLINNLGLKILSLFLAFFVWLVVMNVSNPLVGGSREVPLEILNEQVLTEAGRTYEISGKSTVTVTYDVHTRDAYRVSSSDFRAYVDLAELYDVTGSVQVKVEMLRNESLVQNVTPKPSVVRVATEELQSKPFKLRARETGTAASGYDYGGVVLSPEEVTVTGPISQVGQISSAGVEVNIEGLSGNTERILTPKFYDANGNEVTLSDRMEVDITDVVCEIIINRVKMLPLDFEITGSVAPGYEYTGVSTQVREVAVTGRVSNLASVNKVTIPASELNLSGATEDVVVTVDIRDYLPEGVDLLDTEDPMVEVRLKVERLVTRTVPLSSKDIELREGSEDFSYTFVPATIAVQVQGLSEDLDSIESEDLGAYLDAQGLEEGTHPGVLGFEADAVFEIVSYEDFQLEVSGRSGLIQAGTSAADEENETEETDESEGAGGESTGASAADPSEETPEETPEGSEAG